MHKLRTIEMHRLSVDEFKAAGKLPLVVVLDDVRSAYNVGSVLRTCDAFRIEKVCLCGITAKPPSAEIHKTALGAEDSVAWEHFADTADCVRQLRAAGYFTWSVEQVEGSTKLQDLQRLLSQESSSVDMASVPAQTEAMSASPRTENNLASPQFGNKMAVVFGNEVKGVRQDIVDMSDGCLEIPQFGTKHSMNVSVTAGIVIWEFARNYLNAIPHIHTSIKEIE